MLLSIVDTHITHFLFDICIPLSVHTNSWKGPCHQNRFYFTSGIRGNWSKATGGFPSITWVYAVLASELSVLPTEAMQVKYKGKRTIKWLPIEDRFSQPKFHHIKTTPRVDIIGQSLWHTAWVTRPKHKWHLQGERDGDNLACGLKADERWGLVGVVLDSSKRPPPDGKLMVSWVTHDHKTTGSGVDQVGSI